MSAAVGRVEPVETRRPYGIPSAIIAIVFALFFAWDLFEAISNVIGVVNNVARNNEASATLGLAQQGVPWLLLIVDLLVAPVFYGLAFLLGRRRDLFARAALLLIALAAVAAFTLSIEEGFSKFF